MKLINVDFREKSDILINLLKSLYQFEVQRITLEYGDYFIQPDITIERKTTRDFLVSIIDGRLFKQSYCLSEYAYRPIIIVEGESFTGEEYPDVSKEAIKGALISLAQTYYIPVLRTVSEMDTAWHIDRLYEHRQRIGKNLGVWGGYKAKKIDTQKIRLLRMLPGIGVKAAKALLCHFGSVKNISASSEEELLNVPGVGKVTASKIYNVFNSDTRTNKSEI